MENFKLKYFLGANSCEGFVSHFGDCYDPKNGWHAYIIKGGPGTGKSSFMKYLAVKAADKNIKTELFPCSSDPNSLDAVIFPQQKVAVMDGTSPHIVEPLYPGICEEILNFGQFWKKQNFEENTEEILNLTNENKNLHKAASRYLQAAGQLLKDNLKIAGLSTNKPKVTAFAQGLCRKHIPKNNGIGKEWVRFLCGITPKGVVSYANTILETTQKRIIIKDDYGFAADMIMRHIREYSLKNGYEIITVKNAFLPSILCDHIIIPKLSLSFVREYDFQHFPSPERRIHAGRFTSQKQLLKSRERLRFNKKAVNQLLLSAATIIKEAKSVHDALEKHYISAMDFSALTEFADSFQKSLF